MDTKKRLIKEEKITGAFRRLFLEDGKLKPDAEIVMSYLRDECGARGELGKDGSPYLYDSNNKFDTGAAVFLLGKRRVFDMIIKHLAISEVEIFNLISAEERQMSDFFQLETKLDI